MKQNKIILLAIILMFFIPAWAGQVDFNFDKYHTPEELDNALKSFNAAYPDVTRLHKIAVSPGGRQVTIIEIGPETAKKEKSLPAVFAAADMDGAVPISGEAAIYLIKSILEKPEVRKDKTWYILPVGNPDAAALFFKKPLVLDARNARPHNDDMDDRTDEDGVDDLDGSGIITNMRVKDPAGEWLPVQGEPRLMKKADWSKGEKGVYKLYSEGIDNDKDGDYNEDGPGGINVGVNFPHLFKFFTKDGGPWAGSEDESFYLVKFIYEHKEIALAITFGASNFCIEPPKGGRKGSADFTNIKIPKQYGSWLNIDTDKTYTMQEILEIVRGMWGEDVTESMVAGFLGLGAVVNPLDDDLKFYKELADKYKEFLKENKLDGKRLETADAKDGSFELWAYYHLGLPSFAMDFWTPPEVKEEKKEESDITAEKLEKMTKDDFVALGEEKIAAFLKSVNAPDNFDAKKVIELVKSGTMTPQKIAEFMKQMPKPPSKEGSDPKEKALLAFSDKELAGKGFIEWKPFNHPTLGQVEIGGFAPYAANTPPPAMIKTLLAGQVPWVFTLAEKMPIIKIAKTEVKALGGGLYQVKAWVENSGFLPYPTAMGGRNERIPPIVLTIEGNNFKIVEGKKRSLVRKIGSQSTEMVKWILFAAQPVQLKLKTASPLLRSDVKEIMLEGGGR